MPRNHGIEYNIIANSKSDNYFLLNLTRKSLEGIEPGDQTFEFDLSEFDEILHMTHDFDNIDGCKQFTKPTLPAYDFTQIPSVLFSEKLKPNLYDSLFYNILFANKFEQHIHIAKKSLYYLLSRNQLKDYMVFQISEFINKYAYEFLNIFYLRLGGLRLKPVYDYGYDKKISDIKAKANSIPNGIWPFLSPIRINDISLIFFQSHVSKLGWTPQIPSGWVSGDSYNENSIEAINISSYDASFEIKYAVFTEIDGWIYGNNNTFAGTTGLNRPIKALKINIISYKNDICLKYRVRYTKGTWSKWTENDSTIEFPTMTISALQIYCKKMSFSRQNPYPSINT